MTLLHVLRSHLPEEGQTRGRPPHPGQRQAEHPQRVVLVVGVVEERDVVVGAECERWLRLLTP